MVPLALTLVGLGLALVVLAAGVAIKSLRGPWGVAVPFGYLIAISALQFVPRANPWAIDLLALGFAIQLGRYLKADPDRFVRGVRRSTPVLLGLAIVVAIGVPLLWRWQERRAIGRLPAASETAPNVLLLVLDTVRAWQLATYGYSRPTTPNLDRRAAEGVVFERAYTESPWTLPSHGAMFTGHSPPELSTGWFQPLDERYPTVAEVMRSAGYGTAGFVANRRYANRASGLARGFIHYDDEVVGPAEIATASRVVRRWLARLELVGDDYLGRKSAAEVTAEARRWLEANRSHRFFAFVNFFDAHTPYSAPAEWRRRFATRATEMRLQTPNRLVAAYAGTGLPDSVVQQLTDRYDAAIGYIDGEIETLLRSLEESGALKNTVVIVTSDHGELLGEYRLLDHGNSLYPPLLKVPLIVLEPGRRQGVRIAEPVSIRSLAATIAELGRADGSRLGGTSLVPAWRPEASPLARGPIGVSVATDRRLWWQNTPINRGDLRGTIADSLLYIRNGDGREELYRVETRGTAPDLAGDPSYRAALETLRAVTANRTAGSSR
jgi:arylsulfatase A-like enzyme